MNIKSKNNKNDFFNYIDDIKLSEKMKEQLIENVYDYDNIHNHGISLVKKNFIAMGAAVAAMCVMFTGVWLWLNNDMTPPPVITVITGEITSPTDTTQNNAVTNEPPPLTTSPVMNSQTEPNSAYNLFVNTTPVTTAATVGTTSSRYATTTTKKTTKTSTSTKPEPPLSESEIERKIKMDWHKFALDSNSDFFSEDSNNSGILVAANLGTYNNSTVVVMAYAHIDGISYWCEDTLGENVNGNEAETIPFTFEQLNIQIWLWNEVWVWNNGKFYTISQAYYLGLLTNQDISEIKNKYQNDVFILFCQPHFVDWEN
jgi:hypothetical protein